MTLTVAAKILGIAFAVGLDVLALSIAVGVMRVSWSARIKLGAAFSAAEVLMQVIGYSIGTGAGRIVGAIAAYVGFAILAGVGGFIFYESFERRMPRFQPDSSIALLVASLSVSLDSLGIGMSLPGVPLPLLPLLATVAVSTIIFTAVGLAFGERLGRRYKRVAQRVAGVVLVVLAAVFTAQHLALLALVAPKPLVGKPLDREGHCTFRRERGTRCEQRVTFRKRQLSEKEGFETRSRCTFRVFALVTETLERGFRIAR
jgi:putative Mn2+ efflux pump MntP